MQQLLQRSCRTSSKVSSQGSHLEVQLLQRFEAEAACSH